VKSRNKLPALPLRTCCRLGCTAVLASVLIASVLIPAVLIPAQEAQAQRGLTPGDRRPELPEFEPNAPPEPLTLPRLREIAPERRDRLSTGLQVRVERFRVEGSSVFSAPELEALLAPWTGRTITSEELVAARDAITQHYIDAGYVSSGAVIPDQPVDTGEVVVQVLEARLTEVAVEGTRWYRKSHFIKRLLAASPGPVHLPALEQQLRLLQQDPRIDRVHASLEPGEVRGDDVLRLDVSEGTPFRASMEFANEHSPSVGAGGGRIELATLNLNGLGDTLRTSFSLTRGFDDWAVDYTLPLNRYETTLDLGWRYSRSEVITRPAKDLNVKADSTTWRVGLSQPLLRTPRHNLVVGLFGERRRSDTTIRASGDTRQRITFTDPECFFPGEGGCDPSTVTVARVFQEWTTRTPRQVFAARSTVSFGVDLLGATTDKRRIADSRYVAWLAQLQYAARLPDEWLGLQLLGRFDMQIAGDHLLPIEQFSVGGSRTVRGYRENQIVRDNGIVGSFEVRVPLWRDALGRDMVQIAPFYDIGRGWDEDKVSSRYHTLASVGAGLRVSPSPRVLLEVYWGLKLHHVKRPDDTDLQDRGIHFNFSVSLP